jgi:hypothetical protein
MFAIAGQKSLNAALYRAFEAGKTYSAREYVYVL